MHNFDNFLESQERIKRYEPETFFTVLRCINCLFTNRKMYNNKRVS